MYQNERVIISIGNSDRQDSAGKWEHEITPDMMWGKEIFISEIKKIIRCEYVDYNFFCQNRYSSDVVFIQPENDILRVIIRNRRPGDRLKTESGTKKIKDLMIEKKLDNRIKDSVPIMLADSQIFAYLPGLINSGKNRVACNFHVRNDNKRILAFFFTKFDSN